MMSMVGGGGLFVYIVSNYVKLRIYSKNAKHRVMGFFNFELQGMYSQQMGFSKMLRLRLSSKVLHLSL